MPEVGTEPRAIARQRSSPGSLPVELSSFVGRSVELERLPWGADHYLSTGITVPADGYTLLRQFDAILIGLACYELLIGLTAERQPPRARTVPSALPEIPAS